jgi:hypothetical protein
VLDQGGAWSVVVDPVWLTTGTGSLKVFLVTDQTGTITKGGSSVNVNLPTPGQNGRFTFNGANGLSVTANITGATFPGCSAFSLSFIRPDGSTFASTSACGATATLGPVTLDTAGTWTVLVDPTWLETGTASLSLS